MMILKKRYEKTLNGKTPKWFKDWYAFEFVPYKVKMDVLLIMGTGILVGIIVSICTG
jgi:hypothetical protein